MRREPELQPLPDGELKISAEHFRRVVRRVESIRPREKPDGSGAIRIYETDGNASGLWIDFEGSPVTFSETTFQQYEFEPVTLNVCSGSSTVALTVLSVVTQSAVTALVFDPNGTITLLNAQTQRRG